MYLYASGSTLTVGSNNKTANTRPSIGVAVAGIKNRKRHVN